MDQWEIGRQQKSSSSVNFPFVRSRFSLPLAALVELQRIGERVIFLLIQFHVSFPSGCICDPFRFSFFLKRYLHFFTDCLSFSLLSGQEINDAFRELRSVIPELPEDAGERSDEYSDNASSSSKLTKITTLRLAVNYIAALSDILKQTDAPSDQSDASDSCASGAPATPSPPSGPGQDVLSSIALDLDLETLNAGDFSLTETPEDVRDAALRLLFDNSCGRTSSSEPRCRPASGNSFDLPSYHSPSTTETDSIESFAGSTGWEFASTEGSLGDVCENFDLILESEDGDGGY